VVGNLKFDVVAAEDALVRARELRQGAGSGRFIWTAGSTHPGEEALVLEAFLSLRRQVPDALLILVPRHPERSREVAALCDERGLTVTRLTLARRARFDMAVLLGDTVGELQSAYAAADATFVGGSLVPAGGHNPLEPAGLGVPVTVGRHTRNFASIYARLRDIGAVEVVDGAAQLAQAMLRIKRDPQEAQRRGRVARDFVNSSRGTAKRVAELLRPLIRGCPPHTSGANSQRSRELA
jgi:3-deoxy-D-manno-octulosonic-acid transferase